MTVAGREGQGATDTASERMGQTVGASPIAASLDRKGVTGRRLRVFTIPILSHYIRRFFHYRLIAL